MLQEKKRDFLYLEVLQPVAVYEKILHRNDTKFYKNVTHVQKPVIN